MVASLTEEQMRSLLQDPAASPVLSSADYANIILLESTPYRQLAQAARALAAAYAAKVSVSVGTVRISNQQKFEHYRSLSLIYDNRAQAGGGISGVLTPVVTGDSVADMAGIVEDEDIPKPMFTTDMGMESYQIGSDLGESSG